ncbi:hypothetical protein D3C81_1350130 [compost metagenome]
MSNIGATSEVIDDIITKRTPQIGEKVVILHEVKRSKEGTVLGLQRTGNPKVEEVTAVYLDGNVRVGNDFWEVERNKRQGESNILWATVNNHQFEDRKNEH